MDPSALMAAREAVIDLMVSGTLAGSGPASSSSAISLSSAGNIVFTSCNV